MSHVDPAVDFGNRTCVCGHYADEHVDGEENCTVCDCKNMVEFDPKESIDYRR